MTRRTLIAAVVLAGALMAAIVTPSRAATAAAPLFVDAREWSVTLSRATVPAGPVALQLHNAGEDDHDVRFRRLDRRGRPAGPTQQVAVTTPGAMTEARLYLRQGRWRVWCSLDGHARAGMRTTLRAR
ncbi:MAG: hypothetical protein ACSLFR_04290 [Solirubrobacteraceae bacterium]